MFIKFWIFVPFFAFFPLVMYKKSNYLLFEGGGYVYSRGYVYCLGQTFQRLCLFKVVRLFQTLEQCKKLHLLNLWLEILKMLI